MAYEYERVEMHEADIDDALIERGLGGWRLVAVAVHPHITADAAPVFITFWERVTAP